MVLDNDERELVIEAFLNNARGIFCRLGSSGELRKCIQSVHNGEIWVNNAQLEYIVEALMQAPVRSATNGKATTVLSKREEEISRLVATGLSNRDVSDKLGLSPHTVRSYRDAIVLYLRFTAVDTRRPVSTSRTGRW